MTSQQLEHKSATTVNNLNINTEINNTIESEYEEDEEHSDFNLVSKAESFSPTKPILNKSSATTATTTTTYTDENEINKLTTLKTIPHGLTHKHKVRRRTLSPKINSANSLLSPKNKLITKKAPLTTTKNIQNINVPIGSLGSAKHNLRKMLLQDKTPKLEHEDSEDEKIEEDENEDDDYEAKELELEEEKKEEEDEEEQLNEKKQQEEIGNDENNITTEAAFSSPIKGHQVRVSVKRHSDSIEHNQDGDSKKRKSIYETPDRKSLSNVKNQREHHNRIASDVEKDTKTDVLDLENSPLANVSHGTFIQDEEEDGEEEEEESEGNDKQENITKELEEFEDEDEEMIEEINESDEFEIQDVLTKLDEFNEENSEEIETSEMKIINLNKK
ncbi:hypothetical protein B5S31_g2724 [[Candida] boidinii]|nr:hypothetical protein B5S31_g2724 [[Candida] boidinii]